MSKAILIGLLLAGSVVFLQAGQPPSIVTSPNASDLERLAAREVRRYAFLRTGALLPLATDPSASPAIRLKTDPALQAQEYRLRTQGASLTISGGTGVAVLYGAYAYAEKLGVRFQIDGDVLPDAPAATLLPTLDETHRPLFDLRGLQPFHDFPEGPDWWTQDDWKAVVRQATKMRLNFIGLHTYPALNKDLGPEPTVWIGLPQDVAADGTVKCCDTTTWYNNQKYQPYGCYRPEKTSAFSFGDAEIFPADEYGPEVNGPDDFPFPKTPAASAAMFDRAGKMLRAAFEEAHRLGMKTCVGTESPIDVPDAIKARLKELGMNPDDPATLRKLYEGMFLRIQRAYPIDWYWLWGHEGEIDQARFVTDVQCALGGLKDSQAPFGLGLCGWGWITQNFLALDKVLPKQVAFSAISLSVGNDPVSPNFGRLEGRPKWAIPWFEDDPGLSSPQLFVGRLRKDAVDARQYGCTGLMGLHWRTRILGPNISALAQAAWEQGDWSRPAPSPERPRDIRVSGGQTASFTQPIAGTHDPALYQTVRYGLEGYRFAMPNGPCRVTLRFCEPFYTAAGKRVFGVDLQGQEVIRGLDVFARVGKDRALDMVFDGVVAANGELRVDFIAQVEFPCIAAIEVAGGGVVRKVNCGGPACREFAADPQPEGGTRFLPVADFYEDWARAQFGAEIVRPMADLFTRLDGNFPRSCNWDRGPGVMVVHREPWEQLGKQYEFVEEMAALSPRVVGAGNRERFEWWLNTFRCARAMARAGCCRGALDRVIEQIETAPTPQAQRRLAREEALPLREQLVQVVGEMCGCLLATLNHSSELGAVVNLEQQALLRTQFLVAHDRRLEQLLGEPLPPAAQPWKDYRGPARLVVLTARGAAAAGESLALPIVALNPHPVKSVTVKLRPLGRGDWTAVPAAHIARAVYRATLPAATEDFEYYAEAETGAGQTVRWPATAPKINQTVVVMP